MKKHVVLIMVSLVLVMLIGFGGSVYSASTKTSCKTTMQCGGSCGGCPARTGSCCSAHK